MNIIWYPLALGKISEIAQYIARDKPLAAEKWVRAIFSKVEELETSPEIGRIVPEIGSIQFRELIYLNYRIIYRVEKSRISILTIRHSRQLLPLEELKA